MMKTGVFGLALLAMAYQPEPELTALMRPPYDGYVSERDDLQSKGKSIRPRLVQLTLHGDPRIRGLADAMLVRLDQPDVAEALDTWKVPDGHWTHHNAYDLVQYAIYEQFKSQPALTFERLLTGDLRHLNPNGLIRVVAEGPDAFNRLEVLLDRFPSVAIHMARIDPSAAVAPILASIERGEESSLGVLALAKACISDDEVLDLLRDVVRNERDGPRESVITALGELQDTGSVELLKGALFHMGYRNTPLISLLQILGPSGFWDELVAMAQDADVFTRRVAAKVLGKDEAGPARDREKVLNTLVRDPDSDVRNEALKSIAQLLRAHRRFGECAVSAEMESAVLQATQESDSGVQDAAFTALRLMFGRQPCRPLTRPTLEQAVKVAIFDPGPWLQPRRLEGLRAFIGDDAGLVVLIVHDLGELRSEQRTYEMIRLASSHHGPLTEEKVAVLESYGIEGLNVLVSLWRGRFGEGSEGTRRPNRSPFRYPRPPAASGSKG